ncbi:MAG: hypothetical protein ABTD50_23785 [Polyangiaceae bacterium]
MSERPTIPASFDFCEFARDSETRVAVASWRPPREWAEELPTLARRSESRVTTRPELSVEFADEAWIGSVSGPPAVAMDSGQIRSLPLDHRAGFLLSLIDGLTDVETLIELSAMPRVDALRIVRELFEADVIEFR